MPTRILFLLLFLVAGCAQTRPYIQPYNYIDNQAAILVYERALIYQKQGNLDLALREFRHYVDYYGQLYHADEAQLSIAQIYEKLNQWNEAINNYQLLVKQYKTSDYVPEAMFRMAGCYQKLQEWQDAAGVYMKIIEKYYQTPYGLKAKEELDRIIKQLPRSKWARKMKIKANKLVRKKQRE